MSNFKRPDLETYYMMIAYTVSCRAGCLTRYVGAVLVTSDNKHILATSYNGPPAGLPHCEDECVRRQMGFKSGEGLQYCLSAHAEQNIFTQLSRNNAGSSKDAILYVTHSPCNECTKLIINSGIKKVVYCEEYPNPQALINLKRANIEVKQIDKNGVMNTITSFFKI